jgi:hypothetical protein
VRHRRVTSRINETLDLVLRCVGDDFDIEPDTGRLGSVLAEAAIGEHLTVFYCDSVVGRAEMKAVEDTPCDGKVQQVTAGETVDCDLDLPGLVLEPR